MSHVQAKKGDDDLDLNEVLEATKALKLKEDEAKKNQKEAAKEVSDVIKSRQHSLPTITEYLHDHCNNHMTTTITT